MMGGACEEWREEVSRRFWQVCGLVEGWDSSQNETMLSVKVILTLER